jgi:hypothetical protein
MCHHRMPRRSFAADQAATDVSPELSCSRYLIRSPGRAAAGASPNDDTGVGGQSPLQRKRGFAQENGFLHEIRNILLKNAGTLA